MKYLYLTFFLLAFSSINAQNGRIINGTVLDSENNPIPYASVGLLHLRLGTNTNLSGTFILRLEQDEVLDNDTLVISVLGYKSFKQALDQINDSLVVHLESHTYELKEVFVTDLSAAGIVAKAFNMKSKNYPTKKYKVEAFFRGLVRNDSTYQMLTEGLLTITDKGYKKLGDTKFYLNELKYIDERKFDSLDIHYDTLGEFNQVYRLWGQDYMNYSFNKVAFFYPSDKIKNYELDSISYFDNQPVFCISLITSPWFYDQLFIRMDNFALIEARRGMFLSKEERSKIKKLGSNGHGVDKIHSRVEVVQYKLYNGKYYLSYASSASPVIGGDKQKTSRLANENARASGSSELNYDGIEYDGRILDPDKNNYFRYDELYITHIYHKKEKPKKGKLMERKKYVHRYNVPYNSTFWNNYNALQLNPNLKRAKSHLKEAEIINITGNN